MEIVKRAHSDKISVALIFGLFLSDIPNMDYFVL